MKLSIIMRAIWNCVCISIKKIIYWDRLSVTGVQLISPKAKVLIEKKGRMVFKGRCHTESGVLLSVRDGELVIGNKTYINRNSMVVCRNQIIIEDGVTIGPNVMIFDHDHDMKNKGKLKSSPILIGKDVWIGAGCIILKGVSIGEGAVIAAGTIITKDVPKLCVIKSKIDYVYKERKYECEECSNNHGK